MWSLLFWFFMPFLALAIIEAAAQPIMEVVVYMIGGIIKYTYKIGLIVVILLGVNFITMLF